jgi:plastocyanin
VRAVKRSILGLVVLASSAIALGGIALAAPEATITVGNNFLSPSKKTVSAGTKVRFRWTGGETHRIVKRDGPGGEIRSAAKARKGVHLAKVLSKRGAYLFVCSFHPTEMRLKLTVK